MTHGHLHRCSKQSVELDARLFSVRARRASHTHIVTTSKYKTTCRHPSLHGRLVQRPACCKHRGARAATRCSHHAWVGFGGDAISSTTWSSPASLSPRCSSSRRLPFSHQWVLHRLFWSHRYGGQIPHKGVVWEGRGDAHSASFRHTVCTYRVFAILIRTSDGRDGTRHRPRSGPESIFQISRV